MNTSADPRETLKNAPMSALQIFVIVVTIALNALDGFDVMSISFASPGIATEWGINRAALGIVLSMELIGMAFGSILLGSLADKIGRRPTMLACLVVMAVGMFMVTTSNGVLGSILAPILALVGQNVDVRLADLSGWRVVTGLGIGGMLAAINAVASEFSNAKSRHLNVSLMSIGYPIGAVLGGLVAAELLKTGDWRAVFYFGSAVTAVLIPVVFFAVPESVHWLTRKQPAGALETVNRAMARMGHAADAVAARHSTGARARSRPATSSRRPCSRPPRIVTAAYFFHITTFYYLIKWVPKLVVDMGFAAVVGGRRAGVGERGRRHRRRAVRGAHAALQPEDADDGGAAALHRDDHDLRLHAGGPAAPVAHLRAVRLLHQRRHRRPLRDHRAGVPDARARLGHRLRHRRRPRRFGARADHRRVPLHLRLLAAVGVAGHGGRVHAGRVHAGAAEARVGQAAPETAHRRRATGRR